MKAWKPHMVLQLRMKLYKHYFWLFSNYIKWDNLHSASTTPGNIVSTQQILPVFIIKF